MPRKTTRNMSPIAWNAASRPIAAATISTVRMGSSNSVRRISRAFTGATLRLRPVAYRLAADGSGRELPLAVGPGDAC